MKRALLGGGAVAAIAVATAVFFSLRPTTSVDPRAPEQQWAELPRDVDVEVLNGTSASGLARDAAFRLREGHLDVVSFGDADSAWRGRARSAVVVRRRDTTGVGRVREMLGDVEVIDRYDESRIVDLSVILGKDVLTKLRP